MVPGAIFAPAMALVWRRLTWYATSSTMLELAVSIEPVSQGMCTAVYGYQVVKPCSNRVTRL